MKSAQSITQFIFAAKLYKHSPSDFLEIPNNMKFIELLNTNIIWDKEFILKNNISGPRYTSYPTAMEFHEEFNIQHYKLAVVESNKKHRPLSLYFHLPFCNTICYYCACNKIVTANKKKARSYLDQLIHEIELQSALFPKNRPVTQLHWGGGTPTFFSHAEMTELMYHIGRNFNLLDAPQGEYSIEIDPRHADFDTLSLIHGLGFNRISLGVQDFDLPVQQAINRIQPYEMVAEAISNARKLGISSINVDLIYGLPHQTPKSYRKTCDQILTLQPERISLFNYAHLPHRFKTQRQINEEYLPSSEEKLDILCQTANTLIQSGYVYIGMDHFAKQTDELVTAQREGSLQRNFQGYSTAREADLIGMGVSAISHIDNTYSQNFKTLATYEQALKENNLPIERGYQLTSDDLIRQDIINQLCCNNYIDIIAIETKYKIDFTEYFATETAGLRQLQNEGLVIIHTSKIQATDTGRLVVRRICIIFDSYTRANLNKQPTYSKII